MVCAGEKKIRNEHGPGVNLLRVCYDADLKSIAKRNNERVADGPQHVALGPRVFDLQPIRKRAKRHGRTTGRTAGEKAEVVPGSV